MLPNFLVIGAAKAGTTSLSRYLDAHPDVFIAPLKELDFFVEDINWPRGLGWYEQQFRGADGQAAVGEASPSYTVHPHRPGVPERIARTMPDVRLIYLVRDPLARLRSYYLHRFHGRMETRPIERALRENPLYLDTTRYMYQLRQYLPYFEPERILVTASEDLRDRRGETLSRVFRFLGVDPGWRSPDLAREWLVTDGKWVRRGCTARILRPFRYRRVQRLVPPILRRAARRMTHVRVSADVTIPPHLAEAPPPPLREDAEELRAFTGQRFEAWSV